MIWIHVRHMCCNTIIRLFYSLVRNVNPELIFILISANLIYFLLAVNERSLHENVLIKVVDCFFALFGIYYLSLEVLSQA